ncbi:hypothetical protein N6P31_01165 [Pectobacterium betavasculorum]|uniref:hypothetical protein n=1 Tax=Pectobacterium betavasculorum TaxID=55207 RepID=UPI00313AC962
MKELKFYGMSDDLFECEGAIREEICVYRNPGVYQLKSSGGGECWLLPVTRTLVAGLLASGKSMKTPHFRHGLHHLGDGIAVIAQS